MRTKIAPIVVLPFLLALVLASPASADGGRAIYLPDPPIDSPVARGAQLCGAVEGGLPGDEIHLAPGVYAVRHHLALKADMSIVGSQVPNLVAGVPDGTVVEGTATVIDCTALDFADDVGTDCYGNLTAPRAKPAWNALGTGRPAVSLFRGKLSGVTIMNYSMKGHVRDFMTPLVAWISDPAETDGGGLSMELADCIFVGAGSPAADGFRVGVSVGLVNCGYSGSHARAALRRCHFTNFAFGFFTGCVAKETALDVGVGDSHFGQSYDGFVAIASASSRGGMQVVNTRNLVLEGNWCGLWLSAGSDIPFAPVASGADGGRILFNDQASAFRGNWLSVGAAAGLTHVGWVQCSFNEIDATFLGSRLEGTGNFWVFGAFGEMGEIAGQGNVADFHVFTAKKPANLWVVDSVVAIDQDGDGEFETPIESEQPSDPAWILDRAFFRWHPFAATGGGATAKGRKWGRGRPGAKASGCPTSRPVAGAWSASIVAHLHGRAGACRAAARGEDLDLEGGGSTRVPP